ncbi:MMPL family transporter [Microbacterium sp. EYE_5]|uniref:MMPL family transporter n=1 Tax=unclassified Microbacterium TaxID=2609290 RepID=UPI002006B575|nr:MULTISPECIES: efflux RND transporter permease subunit [unclassified Microbacterium]MCK6080355.1 MMPL family transporter [Microbacterium sp. EYE_382]MCK6085626.1 MMPL family transporter [Microbacterium sp. EYE_384]MCK6122149.1 MMPL family transporter [Microbacterium sp. EYE_80]MCK6126389.1 MMPL family transporter [Microbacterium sp. EYE_79]MCK6141310.1 MMPL family transporter [Microbacterium sp. EYE_39]
MSSTPAPSRWLRIALPIVLVVIWLAGGTIGGPYFGKVEEVSTNDQSSFLPQSAESTQVQERLDDFTGGDAIPALVVFDAGGDLDADQLTGVRDVADAAADLPGVLEVSPAIPSEDGEAAQIVVSIDATGEVNDVVAELREIVEADAPPGLEGWVTGPAGFTADLATGFTGIDGLLLLVALGAVFVILVVVYRSPLLPLLVLLTSVFALCVALLTVWWLAKAQIVVLNGQVQGILFILVIGAATDYALLYVARFREAIGEGRARWDAVTTAWRGAVEPILASGGTVIAGLLCLLLSDLASNRALGPIASIGIAFAMLSALTFLPALLALTGRAAFWPFIPKTGMVELPADLTQPTKGVWARLARFVARRARVVWILSTVVLLVAAVGVTQLKADGVPASELVLGESQARDGQAVLAEHFAAGSGSPLYVIVAEDRAADTATVLQDQPGVDGVGVIADDTPAGQAGVAAKDGELVLTAAGPPGTAAPEPTVDGGDVMLVATLTDAADSLEAEQTVRDLRATLAEGTTGAIVGGTTAVDLDTNDTSIRDRTVIIPVILVVVLLILMLLLRSILAPVLLILSVIVSFAAALGVSALVFDGVFGFPGGDPAVPLYGFVFLVALGIDYNIFLMSRVREESLRHGTRRGILRGLVATGGVITSAGLVLAATFAALGVIQILFLVQLAFIVAFGVLLDTFIVRSLLVPALAYDIGRAIWWPSKLAHVEDEDAQGDAGGMTRAEYRRTLDA